MGMNVGSGSPNTVKNDINVTPLIDVLLVLLIIFLVIIPIMMKMETLSVQRKLDETIEKPDPDATNFTIRVKAATAQAITSISFNDGSSTTDTAIDPSEIAKTLRPKLDAVRQGKDKVVFVEFCDGVPWNAVVTTMDSIRSLAADASHDEIKVALKLKEDKPQPGAPPPDEWCKDAPR